MILLKDTRHSNTAAFLADAIRLAEYYGFAPLERLPRASVPVGGAKKPHMPLSKVESEISFARRDERALLSSVRKGLACLPAGRESSVLAWRVTSGLSGIPSVSFELHVVGPQSAVAEALLIVVGNAIAEEAGLSQRALSVNNIGSFESSNRYVRDVGLFLRKHIETISPTLRPRAATDPLGTLVQLIEKGHPATGRAPQAMEYLTEEERRRFWELLEYLELFGLPYELNPHILGSRDVWSHALYELSSLQADTGSKLPFAFGGRYDPLASRFARTPVSGAMISISCEVRGKSRVKREKADPAAGIQPAIYFAHLGTEARRRLLTVLEMLRKSGIRVHHGIWHERIGEQMTAARSLATPYVLIMGHKEAVEGTILVREVATNSQEAIPLPELPAFLKRRRVGLKSESVR
jgi:histidyl-tRNA synthetase